MFPWFIESIGLSSYFTVMMLAFYLTARFAAFFAPTFNIRPERMIDLTIILFLCGVLGARILHIVAEDYPGKPGHPVWEYYLEDPLNFFKFWQGGFALYGGYLLSALAFFIYIFKNNLNWRPFADISCISLALGTAIGRFGCFLGGCCFGAKSDSFFAMDFPGLAHSVHPTQLYHTFSNLFIFLYLYLFTKRKYENKKMVDGQAFSLFVILYSISRFMIEFLRDDNRGLYFNELLSTSQLISLCLLPLGIFFFYYFEKSSDKNSKAL